MSLSANTLSTALTSNSTAAAFTAKIPVTAIPTNDGFFDLTSSTYAVGGRIPTYVDVIPYCTAVNTATFSMRVWGWSKQGSALYVPQLIAELACTGAAISGTAIAANHFMCGTIAVTYGPPAGQFRDVVNPASALTASILLHLRGCHWLEFDFSINSGTATQMNAFFRGVDQ